jgi:hypothetical protein
MGETAQEFVAAVMMRDGFGDHRAESRHALSEPGGDPTGMESQIGAARSSSHESSEW